MFETLLDRVYPLGNPSRTRPIDKPMEVLCLGLSRSGTDSLRSALETLGYEGVYHGFVITSRQREDCKFWVPLMQGKYKTRSVLKDIPFDNVLGNSQAITDGPANVFGEELMSFYPDAKVILNRRRNVNAWYESMKNNCREAFSTPMYILSCFEPRLYWLWRNFDLVMNGYFNYDFENSGKPLALQHYVNLQDCCKENQREYLDWAVEDGWEPLCEFLNKPVPDVPFPKGNSGNGEFQENMMAATRDMIFAAIRNISILVLIMAAAIYYWPKDTISFRHFTNLIPVDEAVRLWRMMNVPDHKEFSTD